jgi:anthranilate synthase component 1
MAYDAVRYFEKKRYAKENSNTAFWCLLCVYKTSLRRNHFKNEAYIFLSQFGRKNNNFNRTINTNPEINYITISKKAKDFAWNLTDNLNIMWALAKNIVSMVMYSAGFIEGLPSFKGCSEFNVYRDVKVKYCHIALTIAISKCCGSSPLQLYQENRKARNSSLLQELSNVRRWVKKRYDSYAKIIRRDKRKQWAYVMLMDLARNDLSRNGHHVNVEKYKYSFSLMSFGFQSNGTFAWKCDNDTESCRTTPAEFVVKHLNTRTIQLIENMKNKPCVIFLWRERSVLWILR